MKKFLAFGAAVLGLTMVGCTPKPSLLGTWRGDEDAGSVQTIRITADQLTIDFKEGSEDVQAVCSYEVSDDMLSYTFEEMIVGSQLLESAKGKTKKMTYVFKDNDHLEVTPINGQPMVWERVK